MEPTAQPPPNVLVRLWRGFKIGVVAVFVVWNLLFLLLRNPLDIWWDDYIEKWCKERAWWPTVQRPFEKVDNATQIYGRFFGIDQNWIMFTAPLARESPFLAARLDFTDGSSVLLFSENEPLDLNHFLRVGGWRQRKLEDRLTSRSRRAQLPDHPELPLWEAYARWSVRRWHEQSPEDERTVRRVVLIDRRIRFPEPGKDPRRFEEPKATVFAVFDPDGRFLSKWEDE